MKTFGLGKGSSVHTFGLGGIKGVLVTTWKNTMKFTVYVTKTIRSTVRI